MGPVARGPVAPTVEADAALGRGAFDGQEWTYRNGFDAVLARTPRAAWENPSAQGWERIKHNARREVWRAKIGGVVYYLKYYWESHWTRRLRGLFRESACEAEWRGGVYALRAGIAAVRPAGFTVRLRCPGGVAALLVTEAVEPAYPLDEFWEQVCADDDPRRRRHTGAQVTELLAEMIARAHQAGFEHLDMHAENVLVQPIAPGRYRTLLVDLQSARLCVPLSDRAVVRNLAQLNQWFRRHATLSQRLRFLRAYLRWRNEFETGFEYARQLRGSFRELVRALARVAERHAERLAARRDRRAGRDGRYFMRLRLPGGWRGYAVRQTKHELESSRASGLLFDRTWWRAQLLNPLRWFAGEGQTCKDSHSAAVRRAVLPHPRGALPVVLKRPRARNWRRWLSLRLAPSRSLRGWRRGHALLHRHLSAARPLAVLERRRGPLVLDSLLVTEYVPGAVDLETYLRTEAARHAPADWLEHKRRLAELLAQHLRRLEEHGFIHRDCKGSNILFRSYPSPELFWIDLDGLRHVGRRAAGDRHRLRALTCLHVSLLNIDGLTRTDRARFLKLYCARWGVGPRAWRDVWRALAPRVAGKLRAKAARRQWKRAHYGRE